MDKLPTNLELKNYYIRRLLYDLVLVKDEKVIDLALSNNKEQQHKRSFIKPKYNTPSLKPRKYIDPNGFSTLEEDRKDAVLTLHYYND